MHLKNTFALLLLLVSSHIAFSQVVLWSQPLDLKKGSGSQMAMLAADKENLNLVAFTADKENLTALHYNRVLFFADSLVTKHPDVKYEFMAGYSFEDNGNSHVYWASLDYRQIEAIGFDFTNKTISTSFFELPLKDEEILNTFSDNNSFYIMTLTDGKDHENILKFHVFKNGLHVEKTIDLSGVSIFNTANKKLTLNNLLKEHGLQKIETKGFTALPEASQKIKFYIVDNEMVLTLDDNAAGTHIININLLTYQITQDTIDHVKLDAAADANSFLHNGKLYQFKLNKDQLALTATDLYSGEIIKTYTATAADSISFRNSEFITQTGSQSPRILKNTKQFLRRASSSDVGLSVYQTPDDLLITMGGIRMVMPTGEIIAGVALAAAGASPDFLDRDTVQLVYFEGLFDDNFEHTNFEPGRLAVDYLSGFMANTKNLSLASVIPFEDYLMLGYYDSKAKEFVLRKFRDDDF